MTHEKCVLEKGKKMTGKIDQAKGHAKQALGGRLSLVFHRAPPPAEGIGALPAPSSSGRSASGLPVQSPMAKGSATN